MRWTSVPSGVRNALYETYQKHHTQASIEAFARELNMQPRTLIRRLQEMDQAERVSAPPRPPEYVFKGDATPHGIPRFTGAMEIEASEIMIVGDLHIPSTNYWLLEKMASVAMKRMKGPERPLLICGDLSNGDRDSNHVPSGPTMTRQAEFKLLEQVFDWLLQYFSPIYLTPGNHLRNRFMKVLQGDISGDQLKRMFVPEGKASHVNFSWYDVVHLNSGGHPWTITHQYQYRQVKLSIANDLAQKYQSNIITFHQHHTAIGRDKYNRYTIVDCGGLHDHELMGYVEVVPNTLPVMNNAIVFMRNGVPNLLTPYPTMTNWEDWD